MMTYCQLDPQEKIQINLNQNTTIVMQENDFQNVICNMAAIFVEASLC